MELGFVHFLELLLGLERLFVCFVCSVVAFVRV